MRGYPTEDSPHTIFVELVKVAKIDCTHTPGVCARITRVPKFKKQSDSMDIDQEQKEESKKLRRSLKDDRRKAKKTVEEQELVLVNLLYAPKGTKLHSLARLITRLEKLSYVLAWTVEKDLSKPFNIDLVELPRLKMSFHARTDSDGITRLYRYLLNIGLMNGLTN